MRLKLDYTQRLNIHALMGQQRCNVDEVRAFWRLQDELKLTKEEEKAINYTVAPSRNGDPPQATWSLTNQAATEFDFPEEDYQRVRRVIKEWQPGFLASDRLWLEPLLEQFDANDSKPELVGKKKASAAN